MASTVSRASRVDATPGDPPLTPIRRQYLQIKQQYPGVILFFRLGDFYETFDDDATLVSSLLDITLTSREMGRGQRIPMAGVPFHAADGHLARLVGLGHRVAICEQVGAVTGRDLVHREVVRVVTPGTVIDPAMLDPTANAYLAAVLVDASGAGLAYADLSTGEFAVTQLPAAGLEAALTQELLRLCPREVLLRPDAATPPAPPWLPSDTHLTPLPDRHWRPDTARDCLLRHYDVATLDGFGCAGLPLAVGAAGALLAYAADTRRDTLAQLQPLTTYTTGDTMALDAQTVRNLELTVSARGVRRHALLAILDETRTPMGARLLRRWLAAPLTRLAPLQERQAAVAALVEVGLLRADTRAVLAEMGDLERLYGRAASGQIAPRELVALARAASRVEPLRELLPSDGPLALAAANLGDLTGLAALIEAAVVADPAPLAATAPTIRPGFAPDLDSLRAAIRDSKDWLANLERVERDRTGIRSLRVSYNKVFGYYIEVSHANVALIPPDYVRKQTLVGAERYITPDLKDHEARVLSAEEQIQALETAVYGQVVAQTRPYATAVAATATAVGWLDVVAALAEVAVRRRYVRPELDESDTLEIVGGRHPVVEAALTGESFVPNDVRLSASERQIVILTGPNMSGKSTYLRLAGLLTLLAQIGSFVPAKRARIGLVDRIFTRVGAQDDIAAGQSTFMIEMVETATILHHATPRSLVILDEIGRGTSTYDGLAIARAIVEYLHHLPRLGCRTLFATHYHELTALADLLPRVVNAKMDVLEEGDRVTFLRRVVDGGADRSYGLHVAGLAGLPRAVTRRAAEILRDLEAGAAPGPDRQRARSAMARPAPAAAPVFQLSFVSAEHPAVAALKALDVDALSPFEAITRLYELQRLTRGDGDG
ncbi:MAG: DNA mismatch repair protein MutS [Chloroflexi bacterium]|nr:DNA mismatch repair protein MutS [Chloroflexota bacterium]